MLDVLQGFLLLLPTLQANPAWVIAAVTNVLVNSESMLAANPMLHEQVASRACHLPLLPLAYLTSCWTGCLSITPVGLRCL